MESITNGNFESLWEYAKAVSGIQRYAREDTAPDPFMAVETYEALLAYAEETGNRDAFIGVSRDLARCFSFLNGTHFAKNALNILYRLFEKVPESDYPDLPKDIQWSYAVCFDLLLVNTVNDVKGNYRSLEDVLTRSENFYKKYGYWAEFGSNIENAIYPLLGSRYEFGWADPMPEAFIKKLYIYMSDNLRMEERDIKKAQGLEAMQYISWLQLKYAAGNLRPEDYFDALEKTARHVLSLDPHFDENFASMHNLQAAVLACAVLGKHRQERRHLGRDLFHWLNTLPPKHLGQIHNLNDALYYAAKMAGYDKSKDVYVHTLLKTTTHTHVPTYAHCLMVGELMAVIAGYMMEKNAAPFHKMFGTGSRKTILNEVRTAGEGHDIGKIAYINSISQMGRKLTEYEFELIKIHPELASRFYHGEEFQCIYDVAFGHHKTFCGKGGYPYDFDSTGSPFKLIIDIAAIADSIDAATDYIGRNYQKTKTAERVMDEIAAQSRPDERGEIRYSPEITGELGASGALRGLIRDTVDHYRSAAYARANAAFAPKDI